MGYRVRQVFYALTRTSGKGIGKIALKVVTMVFIVQPAGGPARIHCKRPVPVGVKLIRKGKWVAYLKAKPLVGVLTPLKNWTHHKCLAP